MPKLQSTVKDNQFPYPRHLAKGYHLLERKDNKDGMWYHVEYATGGSAWHPEADLMPTNYVVLDVRATKVTRGKRVVTIVEKYVYDPATDPAAKQASWIAAADMDGEEATMVGIIGESASHWQVEWDKGDERTTWEHKTDGILPTDEMISEWTAASAPSASSKQKRPLKRQKLEDGTPARPILLDKDDDYTEDEKEDDTDENDSDDEKEDNIEDENDSDDEKAADRGKENKKRKAGPQKDRYLDRAVLTPHKQACNDLVALCARTAREAKGNAIADASALIFDGQYMHTTRALRRVGYAANNIHIPNYSASAAAMAKHKQARVFPMSAHQFLQSAAADRQHTYDIVWLDYTCTLDGDKGGSPKADINLLLEQHRIASGGYLAVTVCCRSAKHARGEGMSALNKFVSRCARSHGYRIEEFSGQRAYGAGMAFSILQLTR